MRPAIFAFLALLAPLCFGAAAAQPVQPLDRLLPEIRRTHPGQFYDADGPHPGAGGPHYHLKWMTPDGRIIWYDTDARTGRVLGSSPGRDGFDPREGYGRYYGPQPGQNYQQIPRGQFNGEHGYGMPYGGPRNFYGPGSASHGGYGGPGFGGYGHGAGYGHGGGHRGH